MTLPKPEGYHGWIEPESAANTTPGCQPVFPQNNCTQTPSGHIFELDDTTGRERIRLNHRSGTFIEMHPNGDEVHKVYGNGYEITIKDKNILVKGRCNITIEGDADINIKGDKTEVIEGNYELHVGGSFVQTCDGETQVYSAGDMTIGAGSNLEGMITMRAGDCVYVDSDVAVDGELTSTKLTSTTRIDAGFGISAGPGGFYTALGGVSAGIPGPNAVPGTITAATSMQSPLGEWGLSSAMWMTDVINLIKHNIHIHGGTPPPAPPMV